LVVFWVYWLWVGSDTFGWSYKPVPKKVALTVAAVTMPWVVVKRGRVGTWVVAGCWLWGRGFRWGCFGFTIRRLTGCEGLRCPNVTRPAVRFIHPEIFLYSLGVFVKLRCVLAPNPAFVVGRRYEVVEILELPGHGMARKPDGRWPRPGEVGFGMHLDDYFEPAMDGVPALSCGYHYVEEEFFGAIVPNSLYRTPPGGFGELMKPGLHTKRVQRAVDTEEQSGIWWLRCHGVLGNLCKVQKLERSFMMVGYGHDALGRDLSYPSAAKKVRSVLKKLGIPAELLPKVADQSVEFWQRSWRPAGAWTWTVPASVRTGRIGKQASEAPEPTTR
jgi:hypothetical protein